MGGGKKSKKFCAHSKRNNAPEWVYQNHDSHECEDPEEKKAKKRKGPKNNKKSNNNYQKMMAMLSAVIKETKCGKNANFTRMTPVTRAILTDTSQQITKVEYMSNKQKVI